VSTGDPIRDGRERKREKNAEALDAVIGDRREESVPSEDEAEPLGYGPDAPAADAPWTYWWAHFQREKEREQAAQRISYPGSIDAGAHGPEGGVAESPSLGGIVRGKFHALREREAGLSGSRRFRASTRRPPRLTMNRRAAGRGGVAVFD
jgi:hypothetical protein